MQTYTYGTDFGGGVVLAPCDQVFVGEMARCNANGLLPGLTNLGMPGDLRHQLEGIGSDHNPFVTGPSGLRYVRAFDLGGPRESWNLVIEFWNWRYSLRDPRVYPYGYTNSDQPPPHGLTIWFGDGSTRQGTDGDHGHYSLNRANTTTVGRAAWTPALDDRSPWGLETWLRNRLGMPAGDLDNETVAPSDSEDDDVRDTIYAKGPTRRLYKLIPTDNTLSLFAVDGNTIVGVKTANGIRLFPSKELIGGYDVVNLTAAGVAVKFDAAKIGGGIIVDLDIRDPRFANNHHDVGVFVGKV